MAWGKKYEILHRDRHNFLWTIEIFKDGYGGVVTNMIGYGSEPVQIQHTTESDDLADPIKSSKAVFSVYSYSMFAWAELYSIDEMTHRVTIWMGGTMYFEGFIDPRQYQESYGPVPYETKIHCTDGLTLLKNIPYEVSPGVPYTGLRRESQVILDVLGKLGHYSFREFVNVYETNMNSGTSDSPMDQLNLNTANFLNKNCDEVLKQIAKKYFAVVRQSLGIFTIYRPKEQKASPVYGRMFYSATTKTAINHQADQFISRPGSASALLQIPGSLVTIQGPAKKITIKQDYGQVESWINNWDLKGETFDGTDFLGWTRGVASPYCKPIGDYIPGEKEGVAIINSALSPLFYFYQDYAPASKTTATDIIVFEFNYGYYNTTAAQINSVDITVEIKQGSYYLKEKNGTEVEWTLTPTLIKITQDVPAGWTGWQEWKRQVVGLPATATIRITLYPTEWISDCYACYQKLKFDTSSIQVARFRNTNALINSNRRQSPSTMMRYPTKFIVDIKEITEKIYEATNSINGEERTYEFDLGDVSDAAIDNVAEQFSGALMLATNNNPTSTWHTRGGTENKPILELVGDELAEFYSRPKQLIDMNIMETEKTSSDLTFLANIQDSINNAQVPAAFSNWNNASYDSPFLSSGLNIISAIKSAGVAYAHTNNDILQEGDRISGAMTLTFNSGDRWDKPEILLYGDGAVRSNIQELQLGVNQINLTSNYTGTVRLQIQTNGATNYTISEATTIVLKNRRFTANRGTFNIKTRTWKIDLIEI